MVSTVGRNYLTSNIENDEYSYPKAFSAASLQFIPIRNSSGRAFEKLDIRFVKDNITVLIETKNTKKHLLEIKLLLFWLILRTIM